LCNKPDAACGGAQKEEKELHTVSRAAFPEAPAGRLAASLHRGQGTSLPDTFLETGFPTDEEMSNQLAGLAARTTG